MFTCYDLTSDQNEIDQKIMLFDEKIKIASKAHFTGSETTPTSMLGGVLRLFLVYMGFISVTPWDTREPPEISLIIIECHGRSLASIF